MARLQNNGLTAIGSDGNFYELTIERDEIETDTWGKKSPYRTFVPGPYRITAAVNLSGVAVAVYRVSVTEVRNASVFDAKMTVHTDWGDVELKIDHRTPDERAVVYGTKFNIPVPTRRGPTREWLRPVAYDPVKAAEFNKPVEPKAVEPTGERIINLDELPE